MMASRTGFVYHDRFLDHNSGPGHPERPERLKSITTHLKEIKLWHNLQHLMIDSVSEEWLQQVHTHAHIKFVRDSVRLGRKILDQGDTHVGSESYDVALLAAGGVLAGVDAVMKGLLQNAFCAVRPPGHHAESNAVMGFCLFNNVSIGARYAQKTYGLDRVAIIDWDVHHGNGTQEIFYTDKSVLYVSLHQYPFYPGTGSKDERGSGEGDGYTLNVPMKAGSGQEDYLASFQQEVIPALDRFRPELLLISAGFDAHKEDPLAQMNLTEESFAQMTRLLMQSADSLCGGRIVSVLEGGYHLEALARSVEAHLLTLSSQ